LECGFDNETQQVTCNQITPEIPPDGGGNGNVTIPEPEGNVTIPEGNVTEPDGGNQTIPTDGGGNVTLPPEGNQTIPEGNITIPEPQGNGTEIPEGNTTEPNLNGTIPFLPPGTIIPDNDGNDGGNITETEEIPVINGTSGQEIIGNIEYNATCYCFVLDSNTTETAATQQQQ
jgi:hypothetical protein